MYIIHEDNRGIFRGITDKYYWGEVNFVETKKGVERGNHFHKYTKELFYIIEGRVRVEILNLITKKKNSFIAEPNMVFIVDPYEVHSFTTFQNSKWINMLSRPLDKNNPDIFKFKK